jgi:hypothetical protein
MYQTFINMYKTHPVFENMLITPVHFMDEDMYVLFHCHLRLGIL